MLAFDKAGDLIATGSLTEGSSIITLEGIKTDPTPTAQHDFTQPTTELTSGSTPQPTSTPSTPELTPTDTPVKPTPENIQKPKHEIISGSKYYTLDTTTGETIEVKPVSFEIDSEGNEIARDENGKIVMIWLKDYEGWFAVNEFEAGGVKVEILLPAGLSISIINTEGFSDYDNVPPIAKKEDIPYSSIKEIPGKTQFDKVVLTGLGTLYFIYINQTSDNIDFKTFYNELMSGNIRMPSINSESVQIHNKIRTIYLPQLPSNSTAIRKAILHWHGEHATVMSGFYVDDQGIPYFISIRPQSNFRPRGMTDSYIDPDIIHLAQIIGGSGTRFSSASSSWVYRWMTNDNKATEVLAIYNNE